MNSQVSRVWTFDFEPAQVQRFKVALTLRSKGLDVWTGHLHHPPSCFLFCRLSFVLVWFGLVSLCTSKHSTQNPAAPDVLIGHWRLETGDRTPTVLSLTELKLNCAEIVMKISDCKCLQGD